MRIDKLVVVGVGLIGASCALSLRAAGAVGTVVGVGRGRANLDAALARNAVDRALLLDDPWTREIADADVVLVATPVAQHPALFAAIASALRPPTVVTDAGSTKQDVVAAAQAAFGGRLAHFVPAHPIAGSDRSGATAAAAALFDGRKVVVTPIAETAQDALTRVTAMWEATGARVCRMTPAAHDAVFAAVSHLPHVLAFAMVAELAARPGAAELLAHAGSGFRDFTRIAAGSPEMWRDIAVANRVALQAELARYRAALADVEAMIAAGDGRGLLALFERAAGARRRLDATLPASEDGS